VEKAKSLENMTYCKCAAEVSRTDRN
jgi:hypothetical protein